jgi:hypothetical protein
VESELLHNIEQMASRLISSSQSRRQMEGEFKRFQKMITCGSWTVDVWEYEIMSQFQKKHFYLATTYFILSVIPLLSQSQSAGLVCTLAAVVSVATMRLQY